MKENIKAERKHLIITDDLEMVLSIMDGFEESLTLIDSLIKSINGEDVDLDGLYSTTRNALIYFTDEKRIRNLILEENIEEKEA